MPLTLIASLAAVAALQAHSPLEVSGSLAEPTLSPADKAVAACLVNLSVLSAEPGEAAPKEIWRIESPSSTRCVDASSITYGFAPVGFMETRHSEPLAEGVTYRIRTGDGARSETVSVRYENGAWRQVSAR